MPDLWARLGRMLLSWTLVVTVVGAGMYALLVVLQPVFGPSVLLLVGAGGGATAAAVQRKLIRPYWDVPRAWIWTTALGWSGGLGLAVGLSLLLRPMVAEWPDTYRLTVFLVAAGAAGAISAIGPWWFLRRITFRHPWWLLANGVGWFMAWIVILAFGLFLGGGEPLPSAPDRLRDALILGASAGFVIGFEQAVAVVGLLAQSAWERARGRAADQVK